MIIRDSEIAFENAIKKGLNADEFMYICSDEEIDYFKNIETRKYKSFLYGEDIKIKE